MWIVWVAKVEGICVTTARMLSPWYPVAYCPSKALADWTAMALNVQLGAATGGYGWMATVAPAGVKPSPC